jgi:hypothetical protein
MKRKKLDNLIRRRVLLRLPRSQLCLHHPRKVLRQSSESSEKDGEPSELDDGGEEGAERMQECGP